MAADQTLLCRDCKQEFVFSAGEQEFFSQRGFSPPVRCPSCRRIQKSQRAAADAGSSPTVSARQPRPDRENRQPERVLTPDRRADNRLTESRPPEGPRSAPATRPSTPRSGPPSIPPSGQNDGEGERSRRSRKERRASEDRDEWLEADGFGRRVSRKDRRGERYSEDD